MLNRPDYKRLVKIVREEVEDQKTSSSGLIAITKGHFSMSFPPRQLRDFDQSWPKAMTELGLIDDGTRTSTFTLNGHGFNDVYQAL